MHDKLGHVREDGGRQYLRVRCNVCQICWCPVGEYRCIYGGPFHGYEEKKDDSRHVK